MDANDAAIINDPRQGNNFVDESGWIPANPATRLKPPKMAEPPTALLEHDRDIREWIGARDL